MQRAASGREIGFEWNSPASAIHRSPSLTKSSSGHASPRKLSHNFPEQNRDWRHLPPRALRFRPPRRPRSTFADRAAHGQYVACRVSAPRFLFSRSFPVFFVLRFLLSCIRNSVLHLFASKRVSRHFHSYKSLMFAQTPYEASTVEPSRAARLTSFVFLDPSRFRRNEGAFTLLFSPLFLRVAYPNC